MIEESNYHHVYRLCCQDYAAFVPEEMAKRSGIPYEAARNCFLFPYLGRTYAVVYPTGEIIGAEELDIAEKISIIHYLYQANDVPLTGKWIPYRELKGAGGYHDAFVRYALLPLARFFGGDPLLLEKAAFALGGQAVAMGDKAFAFSVFPHIPLLVILWVGDEEFEAKVNILFDSSAVMQIHIEDLAAIGPFLAQRLIQQAKQ